MTIETNMPFIWTLVPDHVIKLNGKSALDSYLVT